MEERSKEILERLEKKGIPTQFENSFKLFLEILKSIRNDSKKGGLPLASEKYTLEHVFKGIDTENAVEITQKINDLFDELKPLLQDDSFAYLKEVLD